MILLTTILSRVSLWHCTCLDVQLSSDIRQSIEEIYRWSKEELTPDLPNVGPVLYKTIRLNAGHEEHFLRFSSTHQIQLCVILYAYIISTGLFLVA